jgi:phosphomannomutase
MTLIKSISGIRGTIGGEAGENLSPVELMSFTAAFADYIRKRSGKSRPLIVVGRDARVSGIMVNKIVCGTLMSCGIDVVDTGLSTTPTVEISVRSMKADGGLILTASHNPAHWNALKMLNSNGEFLSADEGEMVIELAAKSNFHFAAYNKIGSYAHDDSWIDKHIKMVIKLPLVNVDAIKQANFSVAVDGVNSSGGIVIPRLLKALGVNTIHELYCIPDGKFAHNPEPLPAHLADLSELVIKKKADLGFSVDPDVDRLAIVDENGGMFGEEYTLVAVADYVLQHETGNAVSNLSSSRALRDVAESHGRDYFASAVGEVNVVELMKKTNAVIGGEGNGGVIYPGLHYGRDALVGVALFLTHLAISGLSCSQLRKRYPQYVMVKSKFQLPKSFDVDTLLLKIANNFKHEKVNTLDGVRIDFDNGWVHLRKSNTEPVLRVYAESFDLLSANALAENVVNIIGKLTK